ncbi:MAG: DUF547 domain-containing protein [Myxococcota bacterium]
MLAMLALLSVAQIDSSATSTYAQILKKSVAKGRVDYDAVESLRGDLDRYLTAVAKARVPKAKSKAVAFYIDAYNALVLAAVLDAGKPKSVINVDNFFKKKSHRVAGKVVSLDQLEKEILNPLAADPRTHMVLVCAAKGCPVLEARPYAGTKLERRLEAASVRYVRSRAGSRVKPNALSVSKIFEWYQADFGGKEAAIRFVTQRLTDDQRATLGDSPQVSYHDYNWTLNRQ